MERTIRVRENATEVTDGYFPVTSPNRQITTIWGDSNCPDPFATLNDGVDL